MMTYTHKTDLNVLASRVFDNLEILLDSFKLDYKRVSSNKYCLPCPIHGGNNETGVSILTERKLWGCWTHNCHEEYGKNIYGFVQGVLSTHNGKTASFKQALNYLIKLYGDYPILNETIQYYNTYDDFAKIVKLFDRPQTNDPYELFPINLNLRSEYFIKRGFCPETLEYFGVGESDEIKNRAMIPIHNEHGGFVGYISRSTKPYVIPKFLFSTGLNKTDYLYNYNRAIEHIRNKNSIILVEGQGDVWRLFEAGVLNAIGCFGKDLSGKQIELLLKSGATNLIVLLDDDEAGREAKFKIQRMLHKLFKIKFPKLYKKDLGQCVVEEVKNYILPQIEGYY